MGQADRDYMKTGYDKGLHPPACTCVECNEARNTRLEYRSSNDKQHTRANSNSIAIIVVTLVIIVLIALAVWGLYVFDII